jgi:DNA-binding HxlR family transcriptional regulator
VRTYDHFCLTARALEQVGERWNLLVVRDLMTGPKRFTDLTARLGGITPKTLSLRLRELEEAGVVAVDREPGRREVYYRLTEAGAELGPVVDALGAWGQRHAWRMPLPGEPLHAEHLLRAVTRALNSVDESAADHEPALWHFQLDGEDYRIESDGREWSLSSGSPNRKADVTVTGTARALARQIFDPSAGSEVDLVGDTEQLQRFRRLTGAFAEAVGQA